MKFQLSGREKSELIGEGIVTVIILLLLNLSIFVLLAQLVDSNPGLQAGIFQIKTSLTFSAHSHFHLWSWGWAFIIVMAAFDIWVVYWRLARRYRQMQLRHIVAELHYIANGHLEHRIPFILSGQMQQVVENVNILVDNTISAMEEERKVERSKDELITNVSHDIRTPLTSIIGYLGLIESGQAKTPEEMQKYANVAFYKAKQMKSLVEDLFEYTKVSKANVKLNVMQIDLAAMLEQIAISFELEAQKKAMQIHVDTPKTLRVEADSEKLARVFNNLISNAIKYGNGGKNIYLSAKEISSKEVQVTIANDGEPIPQSSLPQVFDRFYRVERSRSKETGGTGLGLAIALSIIELHHGYIYVTSNAHLTQFVMHLPRKHAEILEMPKNVKSTTN